jgi:YD repeat-containing protein
MNQYTTTPFGSQIFDEAGNLVGRGSTSAAFQYVYDYADRLVSVTNIGTGTAVASYAYDAFGHRIRKTVFPDGQPPVTTDHLHLQPFGGNVLVHGDTTVEARVNWVAGQTFVLDGSRSTDDGVVRLGSFGPGGTPLFYHADDLGNVLALTDSVGSVIERYDYDDFGQPSFLDANGDPLIDGMGEPATESAVGNSILFRGMEWDAETALYHDGGTYFDSTAAQFTGGRYVLRAGIPLRTNPWSLKKEEGGRHTPFHNRTTLRDKFQNGDIPDQNDFADLIDSALNLQDDGDDGPLNKPGSDPFKGTNVAKVKQKANQAK